MKILIIGGGMGGTILANNLARKPKQLHHGDLVLLGDKVLRVELPR